ncbi:hypothetical protein RSAG8_03974, partial [Rhizoctonia solani AG-8 WAC10335]
MIFLHINPLSPIGAGQGGPGNVEVREVRKVHPDEQMELLD